MFIASLWPMAWQGQLWFRVGGTVLGLPIFNMPPIGSAGSLLHWLRLGSPLALVLAWDFDLKGGALKRTQPIGSTLEVANSRRVWVLVAGLLIAALPLAAYWFWHPWNSTARPPKQPSSLPTRASPSLRF